jgi:hypothetical protein
LIDWKITLKLMDVSVGIHLNERSIILIIMKWRVCKYFDASAAHHQWTDLFAGNSPLYCRLHAASVVISMIDWRHWRDDIDISFGCTYHHLSSRTRVNNDSVEFHCWFISVVVGWGHYIFWQWHGSKSTQTWAMVFPYRLG